MKSGRDKCHARGLSWCCETSEKVGGDDEAVGGFQPGVEIERSLGQCVGTVDVALGEEQLTGAGSHGRETASALLDVGEGPWFGQQFCGLAPPVLGGSQSAIEGHGG